MFAASRRHFDSHFGSFGKKGDLSVARSTLNLVLGGFYRDFHCTVYRFKPAALPYREWTTSEEEQLKDLTTQRCSPSNIALVLGRTEVSVKEHIRWMRKTTSSDKNKKYWTREENEILLKLDREGKILAQIAEALPLRTYRAVSNQRSILKSQKAADVSNTCVSTGWTDEQDQLLLQLYDQQVPAQTIVKRTGKNFGQVRNRLRIVRPGAPGRELKRWSGEDVEKLLDLNSQGMLCNSILIGSSEWFGNRRCAFVDSLRHNVV